jgi:hypothetical protein
MIFPTGTVLLTASVTVFKSSPAVVSADLAAARVSPTTLGTVIIGRFTTTFVKVKELPSVPDGVAVKVNLSKVPSVAASGV